ncbi:MAG: helicase [Deltaproteobacteria bacterium]|nr:helicase [Deltaproteobacteria bacterium]
MKSDGQISFFDDDVDIQANLRRVEDWPEAERFPFNFKSTRVEDIVLKDLSGSSSPLVITGFTSLDYIIDFVADLPENIPASIRLLIGSEPSPARRSDYSLKEKTLPQEVIDYWLNAGISLRLCYKIVQVREMIESGRLQSRFIKDEKRKLHSKIFVADEAVTLGSSNFSYTGMQRQLEANARFQIQKEPKRYREACNIANNYWELGEDYNPYLMDLLNQLLKVVSWQEALGRACGELLEGDWATKYIRTHLGVGGRELWPSQKTGIAQAMWMVENVGSVLIADATGSGKTRMGAHLLRAVMDRIWSTGRMRKDMTALVCPPGNVANAWKDEAIECGLQLSPLSHGVLSHKGSEKHESVIQVIRRAQSLAIDEAHNFLNQKSSRTRGLLGNMADVVVMFTATPINKGVRDLLMIVDLLGADNLEDSALRLFDSLARRLGHQGGSFATTQAERMEMQKEVQRFTLRRTKTMLNAMVDENPAAYRDDFGKTCRYPEHRSKTYATGETADDQKIAAEIRELATELKGLVNLRSGVEVPEALKKVIDEDSYIRGRLRGAKGLALYHLMSRLRSSKAALIEHLLGTAAAKKQFHIDEQIKNEETGNVLGHLHESAGQVQKSSLQDKLPIWLTDPGEHGKAVLDEVNIYSKILALADRMSDCRERSKARKLIALAEKHPLLIAFDSCLITLEIIRNLIVEEFSACEVIVATGTKESQRRKVNQFFALGSKAENIIALCSDAMSEGLNLQQASAVMLLDMPSVIRIAEQRVGRVDRMNSPHKKIEVWWPKDSESFSLKADKRFFERYTEVKEILGSNLDLPEDLVPEEIRGSGPATAEEMIEQLEEMARKGQTWDGLRDAFQPVRELVDPEKGLVPADVFEQVRNSKARVVSTVSLVRARKPWAFLAIAGAEHGAPKWILLESLKGNPVTHLEDVATALRKLLGEDMEPRPMDKQASELIERFLCRVLETEELLLPRKKRRALEEMDMILSHYLNQADREQDHDRTAVIKTAKGLLGIPANEEERPDLDALAEAWLDLIRDCWYEKLTQRRRVKPLRLKDIRNELKNKPIPSEKIIRAFSHIPAARPIHTRVVSAIVGVPGDAC